MKKWMSGLCVIAIMVACSGDGRVSRKEAIADSNLKNVENAQLKRQIAELQEKNEALLENNAALCHRADVYEDSVIVLNGQIAILQDSLVVVNGKLEICEKGKRCPVKKPATKPTPKPKPKPTPKPKPKPTPKPTPTPEAKPNPVATGGNKSVVRIEDKSQNNGSVVINNGNGCGNGTTNGGNVSGVVISDGSQNNGTIIINNGGVVNSCNKTTVVNTTVVADTLKKVQQVQKSSAGYVRVRRVYVK